VDKNRVPAAAGALFLFCFRKFWQTAWCKRKRARPFASVAPRERRQGLVTTVIVVVVIPIAIGMPAMSIFVPPAVPPAPAVFACFMQVVSCAIRLPAVPAVVFDGFVQSMVRFGDTPLAITVLIGGRPRHRERQHANQCRGSEHRPAEKLLLSPLKRHGFSILPNLPRLGWGSQSVPLIKHLRRENVASTSPFRKLLNLNRLCLRIA